jgi:hypothetical protein
MSNKLEEASLVDTQIDMCKITFYSICTICVIAKLFIPFDFSIFLAVIFGLFAANWPFIRFTIGVRLDKGWILSIMGIEDGKAISISKIQKLSDVWLFLEIVCIIIVLEDWSNRFMFTFIGILFLIFFTSRMIALVMGNYIYWIARINNDPKLKTNASDNIFLEHSYKAAKSNYNGAWFFIVILLISLVVYPFVVIFFPITLSAKIEFALYFVLLFCLIILNFILGQLFNKNIVFSHFFRSEFFDEQCTAINNSMKSQQFFMKFLLALFLLMEVIILPVFIRAFL